MEPYPPNRRYLPHEIVTRVASVKAYRLTKDISYVCRKYHISKSSLMRWNRRYDGTKESLQDRSHRPHTPHPNAHTSEELKWIKDYCRGNPGISVLELYGKLKREKGYTRSEGSLSYVLQNLGLRKKPESTKKKSKHNKPYDTPVQLGKKWQMDVKFVPSACYAGNDGRKFYQYTVIEEASRERFLFPFEEHSGYSTVIFLMKAIRHFGYIPEVIQTDNGSEFTNAMKTNRIHFFDQLCQKLNIKHKLIRPRTPWHNGKVERSHRNDQERFYDYLSFYSYDDLRIQLRRWNYRSNNIPMTVIDWLTPLEKRRSLDAPAKLTEEQKQALKEFSARLHL